MVAGDFGACVEILAIEPCLPVRLDLLGRPGPLLQSSQYLRMQQRIQWTEKTWKYLPSSDEVGNIAVFTPTLPLHAGKTARPAAIAFRLPFHTLQTATN